MIAVSKDQVSTDGVFYGGWDYEAVLTEEE